MTELGAIRRVIIQNLCDSLRAATQVNQWKNTNECLDWFKNIKDKEKLVFIKYDICDIYSSVTGKSLADALDYAKLCVYKTSTFRNHLPL